MSQVFVLQKGTPRDRTVERIATFLRSLPPAKSWKLEVAEQKRTRSNQQNAYLWGVVYPRFIAGGGEELRGWSAEDLHEYFLGECWGWERLAGLGRVRMRPLRRSSRLSTTDFCEFVAFIQRRAAELGIYIPDPNEECIHA
jgi:hypothetical protein